MKNSEIPRNIIGPTLRRLRNQRGWTQKKLAEMLQLRGWSASRETVARLEAQLRWVSDFELWFLADTLGVGTSELYPQYGCRKLVQQFIDQFEYSPG